MKVGLCYEKTSQQKMATRKSSFIGGLYELRYEENLFFANVKTKAQINTFVFMISILVFTTYIVKSLYFLNPNFKLAIFCDRKLRKDHFVFDLV